MRRLGGQDDEEIARELAQAVLREFEEKKEKGDEVREACHRGPETAEEFERKLDEVRHTTFRYPGFFKELASHCESLEDVGAALAWFLRNAEEGVKGNTGGASAWMSLHGLVSPLTALHRELGRRNRSLFPFPTLEVSPLQDAAQRMDLSSFCETCRAERAGLQAWLFVTMCGLNGVAGYGRAPRRGRLSLAHKRSCDVVSRSLEKMLAQGALLTRTPAEAENELANRFISYSGEEVPKMQKIGLEQVLAALPPESHGGSIESTELVSQGTKNYLNYPEDALKENVSADLKLVAKVHVLKDERLPLAQVLVKRRLGVWVREDEVLQVNGQKVLNGMFAVGKGTFLPNGKEVQRLIMNLIPTNSVFRQAEGATKDLPSITQYLSMVLEGQDNLMFYQSDMSSAFYLFRIPAAWNRMMCFDLSALGEEIGLAKGEKYYLGCNVIPMGWASAVSIMQEIADRLTVIGRLPEGHKVRRTSPLPPWLVSALEEGKNVDRAWFHVYLDNFCAMEKVREGEGEKKGREFHERLEGAWDQCGVLSSTKKRVSEASTVEELGAELTGVEGTIGPSGVRLLKLIQATFVVLGKRRLNRKWVQVLAGRWVHVISFRRPGMIVFDKVWKFISLEYALEQLENKVRAEFLGAVCISLLLHTNLRAPLSPCATASDASMSGGAVGKSEEITRAGSEFASVDLGGNPPVRAPILVLSLFNGVGCTFRCYDACGVVPLVAIAYETSVEANRVVKRRWPLVQVEHDVRELTLEDIRTWKFKYPELQAIHIWGGFPCIDLSSVKAYRMNLEGPGSGLFWEMVRIIKEVRQVFGFQFPVKFVAENVASMDQSAEEEITRALGVKPWRFDSADVVPIHRPRFCWTNEKLLEMENVEFGKLQRWTEIKMHHHYPELKQWLEEGATWPGYDNDEILPTAMKSIPRVAPPPKPAGINRTDEATRLRWKADKFRFPPYQYAERFIIWKNGKWRLATATERELLHGMGFEHTKPCWNATSVKQNPQGYEDCRKSLVGDSFNCYSFVYVAACLVKPWVEIRDYHQLWGRLGMAPGFCSNLAIQVPMTRGLRYGVLLDQQEQDLDPCPLPLHEALLRRVNHTGSDIRITTGGIMNPRAFPRQSVNSAWWKWSKVFAFKWKKRDHINGLELRAILQSVEWRVFHRKEVSLRLVHLTDSYVSMSIISKGRTSSAMMRPILARLAAVLLAYDLYLLCGHVESLDNPTDEDSRR